MRSTRCDARAARVARSASWARSCPLNLGHGLTDLVHQAAAERIRAATVARAPCAIAGIRRLDGDPRLGHLLADESMRRLPPACSESGRYCRGPEVPGWPGSAQVDGVRVRLGMRHSRPTRRIAPLADLGIAEERQSPRTSGIESQAASTSRAVAAAARLFAKFAATSTTAQHTPSAAAASAPRELRVMSGRFSVRPGSKKQRAVAGGVNFRWKAAARGAFRRGRERAEKREDEFSRAREDRSAGVRVHSASRTPGLTYEARHTAGVFPGGTAPFTHRFRDASASEEEPSAGQGSRRGRARRRRKACPPTSGSPWR